MPGMPMTGASDGTNKQNSGRSFRGSPVNCGISNASLSPGVMLVLLERYRPPRKERLGTEGVEAMVTRRSGSVFAVVPAIVPPQGGWIGSVNLKMDVESFISGLEPVDAAILADRMKSFTYEEITGRRGVSRQRIAAVLAQLEGFLDA